MALAGELGDGLVFSIPRVPSVADALKPAREGAERAGRSLQDFHTCALASVIVLEPGEALNSERIVRDYGPAIMAAVHYVYDKWTRTGGDPPPFIRPIWKRYCELLQDVPPAVRHLRLHDSHYTFMREDEAPLVTPELVRRRRHGRHTRGARRTYPRSGAAGLEPAHVPAQRGQPVPPGGNLLAQGDGALVARLETPGCYL